jgi:hypothetical protein
MNALTRGLSIGMWCLALTYTISGTTLAQHYPTLEEEAFGYTYEELINLIFTSNKDWYGVNFNDNLEWNEVSDYDQHNCTVRLRSGPYAEIDGIIHLNNLKEFSWQLYSNGRGMLRLRSDGLIVEGKYTGRSTNMITVANCTGSCEFFTPNDYGAWMPIAFKVLYSKFCKSNG